MTAARNAAIWFAPDGYDPTSKGINGRRVAGESFLKGFFNHAQVDEFVCLSHGPADAEVFAQFAGRQGVKKPLRGVRLDAANAIAPVGTVSFPSPNYAGECWRRAPYGATSHAICGITHTTATKAVMQGMFDLRMAPQMPWDAVICTSRAVKDSVDVQMELADAFIRFRFAGAPVPPRPMLPVIPLGVTVSEFAPDPAAGAALRARLGIGAEDVACAIIARLTPHEKFDPLPLFIAMQAAQAQMGARRLHLLLCGMFRDDYGRKVFDDGARGLMPDVGYHILDGADAGLRRATLSGADMFLFPIDNVQETFGLAPIEAMAAGLPVIVSDWDGLKDTVTPEVGFRIPTETVKPDHVTYLGQRHLGGTDSYVQYLAQLSAMTCVNVPKMTEALLALALNPDLRARMGAAGRARALEVYDWGRIIPQMQDLWAEQTAIRLAARAADHPPMNPGLLPVAPSPGLLFRSYPTRHLGGDDRRFRTAPLHGRPSIAETLAMRNYEGTKRLFEAADRIVAVAAAVEAAGPAGMTAAELSASLKLTVRPVERILIWLLKYDFVRG
ncbi:MAG: glycosyltransferase family 4 protein [Pseudomonadota bacterium]